jgi:GNAT superfamily N-acetyltransferase
VSRIGDILLASLDDVRAIARRRAVDELSLRLALESAERGRSWIARDQGEVVAIAVTHDSDDERYIGDLFVEPSFRGQGLARQLLEKAFDNTENLAHAASIEPSDLGALSLASRFRMGLREPVLRFSGAIPKEEELAKMAAGDYRFNVERLDAAVHGFALNELDRHARGTSRPADHASFALSAGGHAFLLGGECVAYAYVWGDGRIGPLACASEAYLVQVLAYSLVTLSRTHGASWCTLLVPGSNRRIARAALRAGLRVNKTFIFASDAPPATFETYVGYHELRF